MCAGGAVKCTVGAFFIISAAFSIVLLSLFAKHEVDTNSSKLDALAIIATTGLWVLTDISLSFLICHYDLDAPVDGEGVFTYTINVMEVSFFFGMIWTIFILFRRNFDFYPSWLYAAVYVHGVVYFLISVYYAITRNLQQQPRAYQRVWC